MAKKKTYAVMLTLDELWEASNLIGASFIPGPGNEVAESVSDKISAAIKKARANE